MLIPPHACEAARRAARSPRSRSVASSDRASSGAGGPSGALLRPARAAAAASSTRHSCAFSARNACTKSCFWCIICLSIIRGRVHHTCWLPTTHLLLDCTRHTSYAVDLDPSSAMHKSTEHTPQTSYHTHPKETTTSIFFAVLQKDNAGQRACRRSMARRNVARRFAAARAASAL